MEKYAVRLPHVGCQYFRQHANNATFMKAALKTILSALGPAVGLALKPWLDTEFPKNPHLIHLIIAAAVAAIVAELFLYVGTEYPLSFRFVRRRLEKAFPLEGVWLQKHGSPNMPSVSVAKIDYDKQLKQYIYQGVHYLPDGSHAGTWRSQYFEFDPKDGRVEFAYSAESLITGDKPVSLFGAGYINFKVIGGECDHASSCYHDVSLGAELYSITMKRIGNSDLRKILKRKLLGQITERDLAKLAKGAYAFEAHSGSASPSSI